MDKDLRKGTEEGLVRRPKSLTKTLPTGRGLFQAGCPQCQEGSDFPDDGFCREERNRETEAGTRSCSLGPLPVVPALATLIRTIPGKGERLRAGRAIPFTHTKEVLAAQLLQQRGWRLSPQPPTLSSPSLGQNLDKNREAVVEASLGPASYSPIAALNFNSGEQPAGSKRPGLPDLRAQQQTASVSQYLKQLHGTKDHLRNLLL